MNIAALKDYIIENPELIELILEKSGFHHISDKFSSGNEYRCAWDEESNPTGIRIYKDTLSSKYFKTGLEGDLITLVQEKKELKFHKTLEYISKIIKFEDVEDIEYDLAFSGLYMELLQLHDSGEYEKLKVYDESELDKFLLMSSYKFLEEGISHEVQEHFQIGYDQFSNRIIVPWRSVSGELIGIMGRLNKNEILEHEAKWFPIIKFPKSKALFGYSNNYNYIQESKTVFLFESEKSVMKCKSQGNDLALALGGNSLSDYQVSNINSLFPKNIFIGLDEGLEEDRSIELAKKLKYENYYENNVYYIYDKKGLYLPKGSKMSPADLPMSEMKKLIKDCSIKI